MENIYEFISNQTVQEAYEKLEKYRKVYQLVRKFIEENEIRKESDIDWVTGSDVCNLLLDLCSIVGYSQDETEVEE